MHLRRLLVAIAVITTGVAVARTAPNITCDARTACFPWSDRGPFCGRGANINLRFQMEVTQPNWKYVENLPAPISNLTYAFCPRVDELQGFNITEAGKWALTYANGTVSFGTDSFGNEIIETTHAMMVENQLYISMIGAGDTRNVIYPQPGSEGRVMFADATSNSLTGTPQCTDPNQFAYVPFFIANITLDHGRYHYYDGHPQPAGTGFVPTCDKNDVCIMDQSMVCIGDVGARNCALCVDPTEAAQAELLIWVSYYGTDASGRQLQSGNNSPLNFQAFAGSSVSSSIRKSYTNIKNGNTDTSLDPTSSGAI